jgi:hypothetical protein
MRGRPRDRALFLAACRHGLRVSEAGRHWQAFPAGGGGRGDDPVSILDAPPAAFDCAPGARNRPERLFRRPPMGT